MFKITPPHVAFRNLGSCQNSCNVSGGAHHCACRLFLYVLASLFVALIIWSGYKAGVNAAPQPVPEDGNPVYISKALFHDRDSVMYYFEQGLMHDDPKGLFVLGVAAHLRQDGTLPEEIYAPSLEEGDNYLLQSANRGYTDAIQAIYCLYHHGCWSLELPEVSHNK